MEYTLKHDIHGGNLPVAVCYPQAGQTVYAESGAMSWMSPNMQMETSAGGIGKAFSRMLTSESMFLNYYTAQGGPGLLAMPTKVPGSIMAIEMDGARGFILQKSSFLAATIDVHHEIYLQKRLGAGFFGGEGFILQRFTGVGTLLVEIDGSAWNYFLQPGEEMIVDTGYMAMMDDTCTMDIRQVPGLKNKLLGGEGLFNTVITGPGNVTLQSHPLNAMAARLAFKA
ncbi:MAG: AIM24 family protein [Clostridiaceae bacterium]|nr:AIM24 family protein [Clostridiaceae bacterium]